MGKENYVSIEVAKLLKEKGYDWVSDSMYRNNYRLKDDIKDKYPGLSDDGYLDLLKKNGGELEEDEVYGYYEDPVIITCKNDKLYFDLYPGMICARPSLYEAQKWLREKHNIHLDVRCVGYSRPLRRADYRCEVFAVDNREYSESKIYHRYEDSLNEGILKAVEMI